MAQERYPHEHQQAKAIRRRQPEIEQIRKRAQHWRLLDFDVVTLQQMRHALIEEIGSLEKRLEQEDTRFQRYVEFGRPLEGEQMRRTLNHLVGMWEELNDDLQEIDQALLERRLRERMADRLGSERAVNILDGTVFASIVIVVLLTLAEFLLPLPDEVVLTIVTVDTAICVFLIGDFFFRLWLAEDSGWYLRRYWIDLVASIPFYEALRFGRLVRIARFGRLFRLVRMGRALRLLLFTFRGLEKLVQTFQVNLLKRALQVSLFVLIFGALSIRLLEQTEGEAFLSLEDSVWWSFTTLVTGGFADLYNPTTITGRVVTVALVLVGLVIIAIFTAALTSVLVVDDAARVRQGQYGLEQQMREVEQKLDLLSEETNQGLIALETVAQALSNQESSTEVAEVLVNAVVESFEGVQASVHLLAANGSELAIVAEAGRTELSPAPLLALGEGLPGRVAAELVHQRDLATFDLEPETELTPVVKGISMVCPLVAGGRFLGVLHLVLPDELARYYLYNRAPMTLAHHAAAALHATDASRQLDAIAGANRG